MIFNKIGKKKETLSLSDVIISKYLEDNQYRKYMRLEILKRLDYNKDNIEEYLHTLKSIDNVRLHLFYFNCVIMDNYYSVPVLKSLLKSLLISKIDRIKSRKERFKNHGYEGEDLMNVTLITHV